jgi:hypothetical protein
VPYDATWGDLYDGFKHSVCGAEATKAFTGAAVHSLAANWKEIRQFNQLAAGDSAFLVFVLARVPEDTNRRELKDIVHNADSHCPKRMNPLCKAIAEAAKPAAGTN